MVKTERLKSWFRYCCKVFSLAAFLGLNSTSVWAVDYAGAPKKEFGSGDVTKYYDWVKHEDGRYSFDEVSGPSESSVMVKHSSQTSERITAVNETEISGNFVNNEIILPENGEAWGAGVYVPGTSAIEKISGIFVGNSVMNNNESYGGAIANTAGNAIGEISGVFVGNKTISQNNNVNSGGAAISNDYVVEKILGDFVGNISTGYDTAVGGAVIHNAGSTEYSGNFIGNMVISYAPNDGSGPFFGYDGSLGGAIIMGLGGAGSRFDNSNFYGNQAISLASTNGLAWGGVLYAWVDSLNFNNSVFDSNKAYAKTGNALGGAMFLQSGVTTYNNVTFRNNIVQSDGDYGYASGGAVKNGYGYMNLTNTSFYDNKAIASGSNGWADGGAITFDEGLLEIVADNGKSEISGNKVISKDGDGNLIERDEAIYLGNGATLDLIAVNNGVIKIDDEINRYGETANVVYNDKSWFDKIIQDAKAQDPDAVIEQRGDRYIIKAKGNYDGIPATSTVEIRKYPDGYVPIKQIVDINETQKMSKEAALDMLRGLSSDGTLSGLGCNKDLSYCSLGTSDDSAEGYVTTTSYIFTKNDDDTYSVNAKAKLIFVASSTPDTLVISGDNTGRVELNNTISGFRGVEIFGTNVFFGGKSKINYVLDVFGGTANKAVVDSNGVMNVSNEAKANNTTINGGTLNVFEGGVANSSIINSGGKLVLEAASIAKDTIVEKGGNLIAKAESIIDGLVAKAESILNVDKDTLLKGDIVVDKLANVSGSSYDFNSLFQNENASSLTVTGGVNEVFVKDEASRLVNEDTTSDKSLTLADGEYSIASVIKEGSTQVAGWDVINIKASESAPSTIVKLESDIELVGSNKEVNIGENAVLDVSGHSPLEITIDGSVTNKGTMDFTIYDNDGEADDVVTIAGDYRASPGALIVLNIEPEKDKADKLVIQGDVIGNTNVFLKSNSEASTEAEILFAEVANDNEATASKFDIWRVEGSPFEWETKKEEGKWYTYIDDGSSETQPGGSTETSGVRKLASEMIAYMGLYEAGFEQTSGLSRVVSDQVAKNQMIGRGCRNRVCREIEPVRSAWVSPVNQNIDVKAPYKYEAKINGLDAGIDIGSDGINKWGVLASYRKGDYEFDGEGEKYYSEKGSELDIDSYGMGLYFRRDKYNTKFAGMVYVGLQKAEISSDDGVKANTDALEIGASLDVSHIYEVVKDLTIAPELQISYQMLDYDNIKDNAGKKVQLEASHRFTIEAGAKVEKKWKLDEGKASIYVKPSIVQTVHGGGKLNVAGLEGIHTSENRTLGRFEIGAQYEVNTRWSVGATVAHTFGADYKDTTFSLDAKYRF